MTSAGNLSSRLWRTARSQSAPSWAATIREKLVHTPAKVAPLAIARARGLAGLEIGGASGRFASRGLIPLYDEVLSIDNVNFAGATLWEADLVDGGPYRPSGELKGTQFIREAGHLDGMADDSYDVVLSSHVLEHLADPLTALVEWHRVCRASGTLVMVLPHRDGTFDHKRPVTTLEHLVEDHRAGRTEADRTHEEEILGLHDLTRDPGAPSWEVLRKRVEENEATRMMHHHVFDVDLALAAVRHTGWRALAVEARRPHDIVLVAEKSDLPSRPVVHPSPFPSDKAPATSVRRR